MPTRWFQTVENENAAIDAAQVGAQQRAVSTPDDAAIAARLDSIGKSVPWLSTDAALSLAESGIDGDDPAIAEIAKAAGKVKTNKSKGFGWHTIGDVVTSPGRSAAGKLAGRVITSPGKSAVGKMVGDYAGDAVSRTGRYAGNVARPTLRAADTVGTAPVQVLQGHFRNISTGNFSEVGKSFVSGLPFTKVDENVTKQTTLGAVTDKWKAGEKVDLGRGYFAGGSAKVTQSNNARAAGSIDGHAITPGRWTANVVQLEPGTLPSNLFSGLIDGGIALLDPTAKGLGNLSKARKADKLFTSQDVAGIKEGAGLVNGTRKTLMTDRVESWKISEMGVAVRQKAADSDFTELRKTFGKQIPSETLVKLADAHTIDEVDEVLDPRLGLTIREKPTLPTKLDDTLRNVTETITRRPLKDIRILQDMPGREIDFDDIDGSVAVIEKSAQNALLPAAIRDKHVEAMARANGRNGRYNALKAFQADTTEHLMAKAGIDRTAARKLTRMVDSYDEEVRKYFTNEAGQNMPVIGAKIDGNGYVTASPQLLSEYVNRTMPLPDPRHIRNMTTKWGRLLSTREIPLKMKDGTEKLIPFPIDQSIQVAEWMTTSLWKPAVLFRLAYPIRVVAEEMMRMAGSGLHSMLNHPISYIAYLTGRKGNLDFNGNDIKTSSQLAADVDEFAAAMSRGSDYVEHANIARGARRNIRLENPDARDDYVEAWGDELLKIRGDELSRRVVGDWDNTKWERSLDNAQSERSWYREKGPKKEVKVMMPAVLENASNLDKTKWYFREGAGRKIRMDLAQADGREGLSNDVALMDKHIDDLMNRVEVKTQGDPDLIRAIATGKLPDGSPIREGMSASKAFTTYLRKQADELNGPATVNGDMKFASGSGANTLNTRMAGGVDKVTAIGFNHLASKPTNYLARSPTFMQYMWQRGEEIIGFMDPTSQAKFINTAKDAKMGRATLKRLSDAAKESHGDVGLDEALLLSKLYASNATKDLLFDYTKRGQFFDAYKIVFPFGDAWKEVMTSWAHIAKENPAVIRRGQQVITGGREADPDNSGQGFFYKDPTTGAETFAYPGSKHINKALFGLPIPMTAPVSGLNIFGTVLPGTGPVFQLAAGSLIPDIPEYDEIHKMIFPYGETDRNKGGLVESYLPAWIQKLRQSGMVLGGKPDERLFNNTVMDIQTQLLDAGKYDPNDPDSMQDAFEEAKGKAKWLYVLRGLAQSTAPSPPSPEFLVHDQDGRLTAMDMLVTDLHKMTQDQAAGGYSTANKRFLEKYGDDVFLLMQSKSESPFPATKAGRDWAREQPELAKRFPDVYGFFAPRDDKFNIDAYGAQFRSGERKALPPKEIQEGANAKLAAIIWDHAKSKVKGRTDDAAMQWKRATYDELLKTYPGFGGEFDPNKTRVAVIQLQGALKDDAVKKTDAGKGLAMYFEARDNAIKTAQAQGLTKLDGNKGAAYLREWLRGIGAQVEMEHPDFGDVWERVLSREVQEKTEDN